MPPYIFRLPDIGEGVAEAEIVAWHVKVGQLLEEEQALVDVMTDKATVEMTSPVAGRIVALHGEIGQMLAVGAPLVEVDRGEEGAVAPAAPEAELPAPAPAAVQAERPKPPVWRDLAPGAAPIAPAFTTRPLGEAPLAAPATRRRAFELGIPLQFVSGSGPAGRITPQDLDSYIAHGPAGVVQSAGPAARTGVTETKIVGLRRKIAEKMQESKRRIPHFSYVEEFDMTELEALRKDLNENRTAERPKLTLLPFLMRALVKLLPEFPSVNARFDDEANILRVYDGIHIGIATQTPGGLMVPVVRHVETLGLWDCARALARVSAAARDGSARREELTGSTITLTSLGAIGGIAATPVINHPEVAIIGPNKLVERPVVVNGQVAVRTMMNVSSSFDHRIVDGYDAALYIQGLKRLIERPALLFLDENG
jgi:2-oxoisovalerate dehydrogenase E2 component (dihydrolipoyl transacylase)